MDSPPRGKSIEERLQWIEDRIEIEDVVTAAALFIDTDDFERAKSMYTEDATLDIGDAMGENAQSMSREEFWTRIYGMLKGMYINWHHVSNFNVEVTGDTAKTISEVRAVHQVDQGDGVITEFAAHYYHTLVRTSLGWRIEHQRAVLRFVKGDHAVLSRAKALVTAGKIKGPEDRRYRHPEGVDT